MYTGYLKLVKKPGSLILTASLDGLTKRHGDGELEREKKHRKRKKYPIWSGFEASFLESYVCKFLGLLSFLFVWSPVLCLSWPFSFLFLNKRSSRSLSFVFMPKDKDSFLVQSWFSLFLLRCYSHIFVSFPIRTYYFLLSTERFNCYCYMYKTVSIYYFKI